MTCSGAVALAGGRRAATTATVTLGSAAPTIHPTTSSSSSLSRIIIMKEEWRRYGASRRKLLVEKDEKDGGTSFELHKKCPIQRYFQIADRVVSDFRSKCADPSADIEETYVMGHRLLAFLGKALPQHPDYKKLAVAELCKQSVQDLDWIKLRMQEIALKIDEEQLNLYITMDFDPELEDDDSSVSSEEADTGFADFSKVDSNEVNWEGFTSWAFQDDAPSTTATDTNVSSSTSSKSQEANTSTDESSEPKTDVSEQQPAYFFDTGFSAAVGPKPKVDKSREEEEVTDEPHAYVKFHDDEDNNDNDEEEDDDDDDHYRYVLSEDGEDGLSASILQQIAEEDVQYESDSEAVDSWAQDAESGATLSGASSGTALTYDPARIAFREIMNRLPQDKYTTRNHRNTSSSNISSSPPSPPPPPVPPTNTPSSSSSEDEERKTVEDDGPSSSYIRDDHWASFDFASARRQVRLARLRNRTNAMS